MLRLAADTSISRTRARGLQSWRERFYPPRLCISPGLPRRKINRTSGAGSRPYAEGREKCWASYRTSFAPSANPIGVDFGSDCLRLAQVQRVGSGKTDASGASTGEYKLLAAASADVPQHVRHNPESRLQFFTETTRDLLAQGGFRGRDAILGLPAASMFIQHLRIPKMDEEQTKKSLPWEARGKLPIDPNQALLRHLIAGEVYHDQEAKNEVIVMAAAREVVNQLLAAASKAKLNVVGMNVEPKALVDCFGHVYRRKTDSEVTSCYIDVGCVATRAVIARGGQIFFARSHPDRRRPLHASSCAGDELLVRRRQADANQALCGQRNRDGRTAAEARHPRRNTRIGRIRQYRVRDSRSSDAGVDI